MLAYSIAHAYAVYVYVYIPPSYAAPFDAEAGQASEHLDVDPGVANGFHGSLQLDAGHGAVAEKPNESAELVKAFSEAMLVVDSI